MKTLLALRHAWMHLFAGLTLAALCACGSGTPPPLGSPSVTDDAPVPVARKLARGGPWFIDAEGRVVVIHGTNMINKLPPYTPEALGFGEEDLRFLAENGFNSIRLGYSWAGVEPRPGEFDNAYIDHIVALAAAAVRHGMLPVVNFHQDGYAEKYGGNGAPEWASIDYGVPGSPLPSAASVLPGAAVANENFWMNTAGPDSVGLQDHFAAAWAHVAERFKGDPHTVFELYNEPSPGFVDVAVCPLPVGCPEFDIGKLTPFYVKVLQAVRQVDPQRLIFVEPNAFFGLGSARTWVPAMADQNVAFAFHNYCALDLAGLPLPAAACSQITDLTLANAQSHFDVTGEPNLMNEFGAFNTDDNVAALLDRADQQMLSWMHWAYWAQDFGEVATYGLINDLNAAPAGDNIKQGLLRVLTRPSPHVVAGTPLSWAWDEATSHFQASYSTARANGSGRFSAGAVSAFFVHPRFFPNGYQVQLTGGTVVSPATAPWLKIAALPGAMTVSLSVTAKTAD
ncbi:MAG: cellulase family glycosylhydrolase [Stagnimonas sp.]|nr:cellulase family glycosylhydrolase [Stagnimonas sp.]